MVIGSSLPFGLDRVTAIKLMFVLYAVLGLVSGLLYSQIPRLPVARAADLSAADADADRRPDRSLLRPEAALDRAVYGIIANLLIGLVVAMVVLRLLVSWRSVELLLRDSEGPAHRPCEQ